jgi:hypothetical protein
LGGDVITESVVDEGFGPVNGTIACRLCYPKPGTRYPAMSVIRKVFEELRLTYEEKALDFPCDAFSFKRVSNTEVVIIGPILQLDI